MEGKNDDVSKGKKIGKIGDEEGRNCRKKSYKKSKTRKEVRFKSKRRISEAK